MVSHPLTKLSALSIFGNELGDGDGAVKLAEALCACSSLEDLNLRSCSLGQRFITALSGGAWEKIRVIRLRSNPVRDVEGAAKLMEVLEKASQLDTCWFFDCGLGDKAGKAIASMLKTVAACATICNFRTTLFQTSRKQLSRLD